MSAVDRFFAGIGFRCHNAFFRALPDGSALAAEVAGHSGRWNAAPAAEQIAELRYRLRRDGLRRALVAETFGLCAARLPAAPEAPVTSAAFRLVQGAIVELANPADRRSALALAALARVLHGDCVHVLSAHEASAKSLHELLVALFSPLGIAVGCVLRATPPSARRTAYASHVLCSTHREVAQDYLRDGIQAGERRGRLSGQLERLATGAERLIPGEPECALVEDAELQMLDDAQAPVAIATEVDQSRERLLYEQALELARGLAHDADFSIGDAGIVLTESAARLLERLVAPLGGVWSLREKREELIALALEALHLFQRDVDYRVQGGQVVFPPPPPGADAPAGPDEEIQKLVEVKEGCRLSARREVLARVSLPRFFARYRHVAGVCADARSLENEFWSLYSLKTSLAGARLPAVDRELRMFATTHDKHAALVDAVRAASREGRAVTIAVRRPAEAHAIQTTLQEAGIDGDNALSFVALAAPISVIGAKDRRISVLVAELPDAARHVVRLQREVGADACAVLLSLDEEAVVSRLGPALTRVAQLALRSDRELSPRLAAWFGALAQRASEKAGRSARLDVKTRDRMLEDLLAFSGQQE